jgi:hypothetical protein
MTAGHIRLVDDVFSRVCQAINDVREPVRCLAAQLIGTMTGVRQGHLREKFFDKNRDLSANCSQINALFSPSN